MARGQGKNGYRDRITFHTEGERPFVNGWLRHKVFQKPETLAAWVEDNRKKDSTKSCFFFCVMRRMREKCAQEMYCVYTTREGGREKKNLARLRGRAFTKVVLLYPFRQLEIIRFLLG